MMMKNKQTSETGKAANDYKLQMSNGPEPDDCKLRLYHKEVVGRIELSNNLGGMTYMMAKGDAVKLRDALNDWIKNERETHKRPLVCRAK